MWRCRPKVGVHPRDDAFIHAMPAYLADTDAVGLKWVAGYPSNQPLGIPYIHGLFVLSDAATGRPARRDGRNLDHRGAHRGGQHPGNTRARRTAPSSPSASSGAGARATCISSSPSRSSPRSGAPRLFDRHRERAEALAAAHPKLEVQVASTAEEIAPGADVIVSTAAIVRQPERPLRRAHLKDAMVACAVDFDATLSEDLFEDAGTFVVDDLAQYRYYRQQGYFAGYPADASSWPRCWRTRRRSRPA